MPAHPRTVRHLVIAAVMASMSMVAVEATIVATAMPQIAGQLGGLNLYSWVFSSFLLTQTAMTVVFGKLADLYGRKPMMLAGIGIFLLGSVLAGFAWSMPSMIAFRLIQGIGAGAVQPVAMTIVADLYPAHERGKVQGYLASVWAVAAVVGPLIGGLIIRHVSWAWIFWLNVPIGLAAIAGFCTYLHEERRRERAAVDVAGAALFTAAIAALMVALTDTGDADRTHLWIAIAAFIVFGALFALQERRAAHPMISFALWSRRPIAAANISAMLANMALIGLTTFLPMYVQGVLHRSPVVAGLALTMVMLGWPVGATVAVRLFRHFGMRPIMLAGSVLIPAGSAVFVLLTPGSSPVTAAVGSMVMGLGMGLTSVSALVLIQEIVDASQRGSATASNVFARNLGSTVGATVLGAAFNYGLANSGGVAIDSAQLRRVLEDPDAAAGIGQAVDHALHLAFCGMLAIAVLVVLATLLVPPVKLRLGARPASSAEVS
ncbi:MDR family MFS transporter [Pigmentiphaga soli]|uniref:MFS-type drug efflux transporter P55 n=1 Tax=Pigmentiphaga soli TaxID=1007095 RepID=A0ABP8HQI5_9BURK